eukprot:TRINITY_DN20063_c0_g1_i1.p1 TRINITY_DN20063_c0_g1~~TRINITY_DN20063_c0_g1_i1.p1  ORF type:complete len:310 (-),score=57.68 TRINITY_DN20063_c0_g1_i1:37-966(-)
MSTMLKVVATLDGHSDRVTAIAVSGQGTVLSSSRDHKLIVWGKKGADYNQEKELIGHHHYVEDGAFSHDGMSAVSASGDNSVRVWDVKKGTLIRELNGHNAAVMGACFSSDNTHIVSASTDKTIKLWSINGECEWTSSENDSHTMPISSLQVVPSTKLRCVTTSLDKTIKIWDFADGSGKLTSTLEGHKESVVTVTVSPDGSLAAVGDKANLIHLWDLNVPKLLIALEAKDEIHDLIFSPTKYWLFAATASGISIFDLATKTVIEDVNIKANNEFSVAPVCFCLAASADGTTIFAGCSDGSIRVYCVDS